MAKKSPKADLQNLPAPAAEFIRIVIKKMRYRRKARADVMAELAAHFEDELKDCTNDEEKEQRAQRLIAGFGDVKLLAVLLRRAKKRCRPLWRTVVARTFQTAGILILCLVVYVVWFFSGKPVVTVDYVAELNRMVRPASDESLNAAPLYNKAVRLYEEKSSDEISELLGKKYKEVTGEQKQLIKAWLQSSSEALELVIAGTQKPYYWHKYEPQDEGGMLSVRMPDFGGYRKLAHSLRWRAWLNAEGSRHDDAFSDMIACYRLGHHFRGDKILIEQLVGIALQALSVRTIRDIVSEHRIESTLLSKLQEELQRTVAHQDFSISLKAEKLFMYDEIQRCFTEDRLGNGHLYLPRIRQLIGEPAVNSERLGWFNAFCEGLLVSGRYLFTHPNRQQTFESVNEFYDLIEGLTIKTAAQMHTESDDIDDKLDKLFNDNIFVDTLAPAVRKVLEIGNRLPADVRGTITLIALLRYKQDTGAYPQNLQELISAGYLDTLPMNPWSDRPLVYRSSEDDFILYSVGWNFIDDGGQVYRDDKGRPKLWADEGDAVFWPVAK
jgi:hypothetical protein